MLVHNPVDPFFLAVPIALSLVPVSVPVTRMGFNVLNSNV
jgi:hypothetical protein